MFNREGKRGNDPKMVPKNELFRVSKETRGSWVPIIPKHHKTIYVNLEEVTNDDQTKWNEFRGVLRTYDESCQEPENASVDEKCGEFGATPMVLIFEDGKLKDSWVGALGDDQTYDDFAEFLEENGYSK